MPLPRDLDEKIRSRFDELISEADELGPKMEKVAREYTNRYRAKHRVSPHYPEYGHVVEYQALVEKVLNLVGEVLHDTERGREIAETINTLASKHRNPRSLEHISGTLRGLRDIYRNGFIRSVQATIVANISSDFMAQVDEILTSGRSAQYDHAFAAVMCGAVLEDSLRRLCERQTPPLKTLKRNQKPKRLSALIEDLHKAKVYNPLKADQLRAWAKVRNHAAHAEFSEFNRADVEDMVRGVRNFLADYM